MKKLLFTILLYIISVAGFAQNFQQQTPTEKASALKILLSLSDDQTVKIKTIYTNQEKSTDSLLQASKGEYNVMTAKMPLIMNAANAKIKAVLTTKQAAAFQKQIDAQAERMRQIMQQGMRSKTAPPPKQ